jgi:hypothetical protein
MGDLFGCWPLCAEAKHMGRRETAQSGVLTSLRSGTFAGMRGVPIVTLGDEALSNIMRKAIAHGLGE